MTKIFVGENYDHQRKRNLGRLMAYKIEFFGWCNEHGHDKIWGFVTIGDDQLYSFWGKRGAKLAFKKFNTRWIDAYDLHDQAEKKCRVRKTGSYHEVPVTSIERLVPNFFEQFENQLTLAKLFDNFRGTREEE